jgi:hypothetical protein
MPIELRRSVPSARVTQLKAAFLARSPCYQYRVKNYYLDNAHGAFSMVSASSPRLRIREYTDAERTYARLEHKFIAADGMTSNKVFRPISMVPELRALDIFKDV